MAGKDMCVARTEGRDGGTEGSQTPEDSGDSFPFSCLSIYELLFSFSGSWLASYRECFRKWMTQEPEL